MYEYGIIYNCISVSKFINGHPFVSLLIILWCVNLHVFCKILGFSLNIPHGKFEEKLAGQIIQLIKISFHAWYNGTERLVHFKGSEKFRILDEIVPSWNNNCDIVAVRGNAFTPPTIVFYFCRFLATSVQYIFLLSLFASHNLLHVRMPHMMSKHVQINLFLS